MKAFAIYFLMLGLTTPVFAQQNTVAKNFTLRGKIYGKDSGTIILSFGMGSNYKSDTVNINNGEFIFRGSLFEPTVAVFKIENEYSGNIYLESAEMRVEIIRDRLSDVKLIGSKTQEEKLTLNKQIAPFNEWTSEHNITYAALKDSMKNSDNEVEREIFRKKLEILDVKFVQIRKQSEAITLRFIQTHPNSFLSPEELFIFDGNELLSFDSINSIYSGFTIRVQNSAAGKEIRKNIIKKKNNLPGAIAPDFKAIDLNNKTITLSQFKGNVVILDFWASWCKPCRERMNHLKDIYQKYHSKGLEVIAVSKDYNRKQWVEAVKQDSTAMWFHIPIAEKFYERIFTKDDVQENYFVQSIPVQFLIDRNGKIVTRFKSSIKEDEKLLDIKLEELLR